MNTPDSPLSLRLCFAVGLCTLATLLLELSLTRIFSVVLFYHFAFMAISVALFGLGAGGVLAYYVQSASGAESIWARLGRFSTYNAFVVVAALWVVLRRPLSFQITWDNALVLGMIYLVCAFPFLLAGTVISLAISNAIRHVSRVYFWDLLGAAVGCLMLVPLLDSLGGPGTVMMAGAFFALAGALWHSLDGWNRRATISLAIAGMLALVVVVNRDSQLIDLQYAKGMRIPDEEFSKWNSFSRISVGPSQETGAPLILIDSDAGTEISQHSFDALPDAERAKLLKGGPSLPYAIRPGAKTLVIGAGGGLDVARALASGSSDVTAVEINPIIVRDVMQDRYAEVSKRLYFRPEVKVVIEDGRTYVSRTSETYDVIQMTLVDSWASTAAGAFALAENHLYTIEAFTKYLERLSPDGMIAITRWEFAVPRESLRVVSVALEALRRMQEREPAAHFIVAREDVELLENWGAKDTILIKRTPFTAGEMQAARDAIERSGMTAVYLPGADIPNPFGELLTSRNPESYIAAYVYDISPVDDNRPFFFYTVPLSRLWEFIKSPLNADFKINLGVMLLLVSLGLAVVGTLVILLLPRVLLRQSVPRDRAVWIHLLYFMSIGVGFIVVEIAFVQRIVLYLGQPTYALTVVIFSMLLSSGIGSYFSGRVVGGNDRRLISVLAAVTALVAVLVVATPTILESSLGLSLAAKLLVVALLLSPAGFLMGMPFPSGLLRLEKAYPNTVRWAWAVNSAASVLGSVSAIFLAIHLGLAQTVFVGGLFYVGAMASVLLTAKTVRVREEMAAPSLASVELSGGTSDSF